MRSVVVDITQHLEIAVRYRIMATPAIAINGKLEFTCMPNEEVLRDRIAQHIR
jgi:protein-disulfide isomerase